MSAGVYQRVVNEIERVLQCGLCDPSLDVYDLGGDSVSLLRVVESLNAERYSVDVLHLVPAMMRILLLPDVDRRSRDLSSVRALHHDTAACPPDV